jgi:hypothetical protein
LAQLRPQIYFSAPHLQLALLLPLVLRSSALLFVKFFPAREEFIPQPRAAALQKTFGFGCGSAALRFKSFAFFCRVVKI